MKISGVNIILDPSWISQKEGLSEKAIDFAEEFAKSLVPKEVQNGREKLTKKALSTSQVRNFFGEMRRIQLKGFKENQTAFFMLRPKLAYSVARAEVNVTNPKIKEFALVAGELMKVVNDEASYNNFVSFMEAIVAYHKYHGGK